MNVTTYVKILSQISINGDAKFLEFSRLDFEINRVKMDHRVKMEW